MQIPWQYWHHASIILHDETNVRHSIWSIREIKFILKEVEVEHESTWRINQRCQSTNKKNTKCLCYVSSVLFEFYAKWPRKSCSFFYLHWILWLKFLVNIQSLLFIFFSFFLLHEITKSYYVPSILQWSFEWRFFFKFQSLISFTFSHCVGKWFYCYACLLA